MAPRRDKATSSGFFFYLNLIGHHQGRLQGHGFLERSGNTSWKLLCDFLDSVEFCQQRSRRLLFAVLIIKVEIEQKNRKRGAGDAPDLSGDSHAMAANCQQSKVERPHIDIEAKDEVDVLNAKRKKSEDMEEDIMDLKCSSWTQTKTEVTLTLESKQKIDASSLSSQVEDDCISLSITGGPVWACKFYEDVQKKETNIGVQNNNIFIRVVKKYPGKEWPDFMKCQSHEKACKTSDAPHSDKESKSGKLLDLYKVTHVKHDFYESDATTYAHVYIKQIKKDTIQVSFKEKHIDIQFSTSDPNFLSMHSGSTEDTTFKWGFETAEYIDPAKSKHKVKPGKIELHLSKRDITKKWKALEAVDQISTGKVEGNTWMTAPSKTTAKVAPTQDLSRPPVKSSSRPKDLTPPKTGVIFDEMAAEGSSKQTVNHPAKLSTAKESKEQTQKPTCKVTPLNKAMAEKPTLVSDGMTGLDNIGNTCFMNSVLQVLSNTRELRDYFLESHFQHEINMDNPLGMGGKLAVEFACLLKILWSGKRYSYSPSRLKGLIAQKATQFTGYAQHDAQEFMAFLLDGLHEDLNRIRKKPYTQVVDSDGRPDEVVANEAWDVYKKRNDSYIVDLFQGQYKSKLVCPVCGKVSITFDPFMMLPVPLPKKQRLMNVTFIYKDPSMRPVKYMLKLPSDALVEQLKEALFSKTRVHPKDMRVFEVYKHGIQKYLDKGSKLPSINSSDKIVVCEVLSEKMAGEAVLELAVIQRVQVPQTGLTHCTSCKKPTPEGSKLRRCARCFRAAYCDQNCQKQHWPSHKGVCGLTPDLVGHPFYISLPESQATYSQIVRMAETYARYSVDIFQPPQREVSVGSLSEDTNRASPPRSEPQTPNTLTPSTSSSTVCGDMSDQDRDVDFSEVKQERDNVPETQAYKDDSDICSPLDTPSNSLSMDNLYTASEASTSYGLPTKYVMARTQNVLDKSLIQFLLWRATKEGRNLQGHGVSPLENLGDQPLDLSSVHFLAMEWKNNDRCKPYVIVQSKSDLECDDDKSMENETLEDGNTLEQCLSLFTEPEVLSPEHAWYCPQCKEHREATKQLSIWRLPHTLIIQLKRFSFRNMLWRDKIDKLIQFPTRKLDLTRFYIGNRPANEPPPVYDLYGVINHYGGILGGHYTAYARCPAVNPLSGDEIDWRHFDDSMVTRTSESQVVTRGAYVLFYRRRESSLPVPLVLAAGGEPSALTGDDTQDNRDDAMDDGVDTQDDRDELDIAMDGIEVDQQWASGDTSSDKRLAYNKLSYTDMDSVD